MVTRRALSEKCNEILIQHGYTVTSITHNLVTYTRLQEDILYTFLHNICIYTNMANIIIKISELLQLGTKVIPRSHAKYTVKLSAPVVTTVTMAIIITTSQHR